MIAFEKDNPVAVRFEPDKVTFSLAIDYLQIDEKEWYDFEVFVHYVPGTSASGNVCLVRDGYIQLKGETNFRTQIALRTIFSKIFTDHNEIPLAAKFLQQDERFSGICTDHIRIHEGWFAIALSLQSRLVKQENSKTATKYTAERQ